MKIRRTYEFFQTEISKEDKDKIIGDITDVLLPLKDIGFEVNIYDDDDHINISCIIDINSIRVDSTDDEFNINKVSVLYNFKFMAMDGWYF